MKRYLWILPALLIGAGLFTVMNSTQAGDDLKSVGTKDSVNPPTQLELLERIEILEKRITKLESERTQIQQADSRDTVPELQAPQPRFLPQPTPQSPAAESDSKSPNGSGVKIYMRYVVPSK